MQASISALVIAVALAACSPSASDDTGGAGSSSTSEPDTSGGASEDGDGEDNGGPEAGDDSEPDASSSDPTGAGTETAAESGAEPPPSLVWRAFELTCPPIPGLDRYESALVELATDVPAMPLAHAFVPLGADTYRLNTSSGSESILDELAQSLSLACGNGNGLGTDTVRVALGYEPMQTDGAALRWDVREVECPQLEDLGEFEEREVQLADGIDPAFVSAHYISGAEQRWSIKPAGGRGSYLTDEGALVVTCGNGNAHEAGTLVRVAFGYPEDERPELPRLRWETHAGECPDHPDLDQFEEVPTPIADGIELEFVAGSYAYLVDDQWRLNPLSGTAQVRSDEQAVYVNCGNGNALSAGTTARVALAYLE